MRKKIMIIITLALISLLSETPGTRQNENKLVGGGNTFHSLVVKTREIARMLKSELFFHISTQFFFRQTWKGEKREQGKLACGPSVWSVWTDGSHLLRSKRSHVFVLNGGICTNKVNMEQINLFHFSICVCSTQPGPNGIFRGYVPRRGINSSSRNYQHWLAVVSYGEGNSLPTQDMPLHAHKVRLASM